MDREGDAETWVRSLREPTRGTPVVVWVLRIVGLLAVAGFALLGPFHSGSMDLPWEGPNGERYGFFGNGPPLAWICEENHSHRSLPFWMGAVAAALPTAFLWLRWPRRRPH
jgi:hypothetical protein